MKVEKSHGSENGNGSGGVESSSQFDGMDDFFDMGSSPEVSNVDDTEVETQIDNEENVEEVQYIDENGNEVSKDDLDKFEIEDADDPEEPKVPDENQKDSTEISSLKDEIAQLKGMVQMLQGQNQSLQQNDISATQQEQPKDYQNSSNQEPLMTQEEMDKILEEGDLNTFQMVLQRQSQLVAQQIMQKLPQVLEGQIQQSYTQQEKAKEFYSSNPDLVQYRPYLGALADELSRNNPAWSGEKVLEELPRYARMKFNLTDPTKKPKVRKVSKKGQPSGTGGRQGGGRVKQNIDDMSSDQKQQAFINTMF